MPQYQDDDSESQQDGDLNIVINQCDFPRYVASGQLFHQSIEKTKHIIYKDKYRAHREKNPYPDHVIVSSKHAHGQRPWYTIHQCTDPKCPIHPENTKLTDVTEIQQASESEDGTPGFECSYLSENVNLDLYPFYKRSIECYNKAFGQTQKSNVTVSRVSKSDSGAWHDPSCKQCDRPGMHLDLLDVMFDFKGIHTDDISDILYKYRFIFDPNYIFGNKSMGPTSSVKQAVDALKQNPHTNGINGHANNLTNTPEQSTTTCTGFSTKNEKLLSNHAEQENHTPLKQYGIQAIHRSSFSRRQTPNKSPFYKGPAQHNSLYPPSPNYRPHAAYSYRATNNFWTPPMQHNAYGSPSPYSSGCVPNWQTFTPPYHQYRHTSPYQTPPMLNSPTQSGYYGIFTGPQTPVFDTRLRASPNIPTIRPWIGDAGYYNKHYGWPYSSCHPFYSPTQYTQSYASEGSPSVSHSYGKSYAHNLANDTPSNGQNVLYNYNTDIDYDDEDPLRSVNSNHTRTRKDETTLDKADSDANSAHNISSCSHQYSLSPVRSPSRRKRYNNDDGRRCHENYENPEKREREKRKRSPSETRRRVSSSRNRMRDLSSYSPHRSGRSHRSHSSSNSKSTKRDRSPTRPSRHCSRQKSRDRESRSGRDSLNKAPSREHSTKVRSAVNLVQDGHKR